MNKDLYHSEHSDRINDLTKIFYNALKSADECMKSQKEEIVYNENSIIELLKSYGFERHPYIYQVYVKTGKDSRVCAIDNIIFSLSKLDKEKELVYRISNVRGLNEADYKEAYEKIKEHFRSRSERINNLY